MLQHKNLHSPDNLLGDPLGLAAPQFRMAQETCGTCGDYHALWPYRRLAGMVHGVEVSADTVTDLIRELLPAKGRVLIAGAADAGTTALVAGATRNLHAPIDVADRCPTPLATCRQFATMHALQVTTSLVDLTSTAPQQNYDVIFGHGVLQFVTQTRRVDFLRNLARAMTAQGALILIERLRTREGEERNAGDYGSEMVDALLQQGIPLPEDEAAFRQRLQRVVDVRRTRASGSVVPEDLAACLTQAGFRMRPLPDQERTRAITLRNGESVTMELAVAQLR
jgi:hypothetical protein